MFRPVSALLCAGVLTAFTLACGGSNFDTGAFAVAPMPTGSSTITAADGRSQVTLADGWSRAYGLNDEADIQAQDYLDDLYFISLSEPKADFASGTTTHEHSDLTREALTSAGTNCVEEGPTSLQVGGRSSVQWLMHCDVSGLRITYLHTTISGDSMFHQLVAWTTAGTFPGKRGELDAMVGSFTEL